MLIDLLESSKAIGLCLMGNYIMILNFLSVFSFFGVKTSIFAIMYVTKIIFYWDPVYLCRAQSKLFEHESTGKVSI